MPSRSVLSVKMKLRFNPVERMAGAFILLALLGTIVSAGTILVRKGFFDKTIVFRTITPSSDSIHTGMPVLMSGVRIGRVEEIDLDDDGSAEVRFSVRSKYAVRVKEDSRVSITRQSWLGDKIFELSTGSKNAARAKAGQLIDMRASGDVGARAGDVLENVDRLVVELTEVARQVSHKRNTEVLLGNLRQTSDVLGEMSANFPQIGRDLASITAQLNVLSEQMARKTPEGNTRIAQILDETSILVRALQQNFLVRGSVSKIREEEDQQQQQRRLAEQKQAPPAASPAEIAPVPAQQQEERSPASSAEAP